MTLKINLRRLFIANCTIIAVILLMDVVAHAVHMRIGTPVSEKIMYFFDLDTEHNIPSFYSFIQLFIACLVLALLAKLSFKKKDRNWKAWTFLSAAFAYLAVDELEEIHEHLEKIVRNMLHTTGVLYYAWFIPMTAFAVILALICLPFLFRLPSKTRWGIMLAGTCFVISAVGGDMASGYILTRHPEWIPHQALLIENLLEEGGEMLSICYFIYVLVGYMRDHLSAHLTFQLEQPATSMSASTEPKSGVKENPPHRMAFLDK